MRRIEGLVLKYAVIAAREMYVGGNSIWEKGDTYHSTITWEEAQVIAAALNGAAKVSDGWIVREIKDDDPTPT